MSLHDQFAALPRPTVPGAFSVTPAKSNSRVGRSFDGHPAMLVELPKANGTKLPRRLTNFAYHPPATVEIRSGTTKQQTRLAVVECCSSDRHLSDYFFRIVTEVLMPEATGGDEAQFETAIDAVISLFKSLQRAGSRTIQGLWAELLIIGYAASPSVALSSWHSEPRALWDFTNGQARLEVKSTTRQAREHTFLFDQLRQVGSGRVLVASLLLHESEIGESVFDLMRAIKGKLASVEAKARLEQIVADSLGDSFGDADAFRYESDESLSSLLLYDAAAIPTVLEPIPPEVKDVSFTVDLSNVPKVDLAAARLRGKAFSELLPSP